MNCCNKSGVWFWFSFAVIAGVTATLILQNRVLTGQQKDAKQQEATQEVKSSEMEGGSEGMQIATFGAGCFWCVEAVFSELEGVSTVTSGYMGGHVENPTYEQVCSKTTGHVEVCQITYDPEKVSYAKLLEVFFLTHDPTTLNQQGADRGPQYRSAIFYHSDEQKQVADDVKKKLDDSDAFRDSIVTEITEASTYYPAEEVHQDFFTLNPEHGYCRAVIAPKMEKFRKVFAEQLKSNR